MHRKGIALVVVLLLISVSVVSSTGNEAIYTRTYEELPGSLLSKTNIIAPNDDIKVYFEDVDVKIKGWSCMPFVSETWNGIGLYIGFLPTCRVDIDRHFEHLMTGVADFWGWDLFTAFGEYNFSVLMYNVSGYFLRSSLIPGYKFIPRLMWAWCHAEQVWISFKNPESSTIIKTGGIK